MRRQCEQGVSKHKYGSHVCQAQAMQDGSQLTGIWLHITFTMVRSFVSLTKDGNRCQVFYAIGWRTLPQKNFFTFFSCVCHGRTLFFVLVLVSLLCMLQNIHSRKAALTFFIFLSFSAYFHSHIFKYKYCTL